MAIPAGTVRGLPFGIMLTGPAGSDRWLAVLADQAAGVNDSGLPMPGVAISAAPPRGGSDAHPALVP